MTAKVEDIYIEQGATWSGLVFHWYDILRDVDGNPILDELGNWQADPSSPICDSTWIGRMQIRKTQKSEPYVDATTVNGKIVITDAGLVTVKLTDDDTDSLTFAKGLYDLELEDPVTGDVYRMYEGKVVVSPNITQESDDPEVH